MTSRLTKENYEDDTLHLKGKTQSQYNNELWQYVKEHEDIEEKLGIDAKTIYNIIINGVINGFSSLCNMSNFNANNRIALVFRKALENVEAMDMEICNFDTRYMEKLIKLSNIVFLKDEDNDFKYIEIGKDFLYIETKDNYFTIDNEGNKIE